MSLPYTVFTFSSHVSVDRYFRLRNIFITSESRDLNFDTFFQKYSSSSPTIPDAKIRTESRTSSPIDSRTSSMTSLTPDEECLVSAGDEEEFVLIPSPMTRQRSKTVSLSIFFYGSLTCFFGNSTLNTHPGLCLGSDHVIQSDTIITGRI